MEIVPLYLSNEVTHAGAGRQALRGAAARRPRHLHARGLLQLPLADDPPAARRDRALRPLFTGRRERSTTIRSSSAPSAPARTWRASAAATATSGIACTSPIRATSCRSRTCRRIPWLANATVDEQRTAAQDARAAHASACRTPMRTSPAPRTRCDGKTEMDALIAYLQGLGTASANW